MFVHQEGRMGGAVLLCGDWLKVDPYGLLAVVSDGIEMGSYDELAGMGVNPIMLSAESKPSETTQTGAQATTNATNDTAASGTSTTQTPQTQQAEQTGQSQQHSEPSKQTQAQDTTTEGVHHSWLYKLLHPFGEDHLPSLVDLLQGSMCKIACAMGSGKGASQKATESTNQMAEASAGKAEPLQGQAPIKPCVKLGDSPLNTAEIPPTGERWQHRTPSTKEWRTLRFTTIRT